MLNNFDSFDFLIILSVVLVIACLIGWLKVIGLKEEAGRREKTILNYEENLEKVLTSFRERNALIEEIGEVLDSGEFTLVLLDSTNLSRSTFKRIDGVEMYLDSAKRSLELLDLGFKYND